MRETPRPARYTLDKPFSWRGRLWVSGSVQQLPTAAQDLRGQSAPWHADEIGAGLAKPDQGGKQEANGGKLAFLRAVQAFTCHGGGAAVPPSSFISLTFTSQHSLLWYFLGLQESTVPPRPSFRPPRPPSPRKFRLPFAANCGNIKAITHWRCLRCRIRFCNRFRAPCRRISRT